MAQYVGKLALVEVCILCDNLFFFTCQVCNKQQRSFGCGKGAVYIKLE